MCPHLCFLYGIYVSTLMWFLCFVLYICLFFMTFLCLHLWVFMTFMCPHLCIFWHFCHVPVSYVSDEISPVSMCFYVMQSTHLCLFVNLCGSICVFLWYLCLVFHNIFVFFTAFVSFIRFMFFVTFMCFVWYLCLHINVIFDIYVFTFMGFYDIYVLHLCIFIPVMSLYDHYLEFAQQNEHCCNSH